MYQSNLPIPKNFWTLLAVLLTVVWVPQHRRIFLSAMGRGTPTLA